MNKQYKKIALLLCVFLSAMSLTACDPARYNVGLKYENLKEDLVSVELIYYDIDVKKINNFFQSDGSTKGMSEFDFSKMTTIEFLDESVKDDLLEEFLAIEIMVHWSHPNSPAKTCVKLLYSNEEFLIISQDVISKYNSSGEIILYIGVMNPNIYKNLINKYFKTQI